MKARSVFACTGAAFIAMSVVAPAQAQDNASLRRNLARDICAECHAVEAGVMQSPNPDSPAFQELANIPGMNTMAIKVWLQSPHQSMPLLVLDGPEIEELSAYIISLKPLSP